MPESVTVHPCSRLCGSVRVPGDKSISHRVAILSAMASGTSRIRGYLMGEDCLNTLKAVEQIGAGASIAEEEITVRGTSGRFQAPRAVLDMGNSGTGMRLMAGLLAGQPFTAEMTGDASLRSRPMRRIREPLERMGARVELLGPNGCAPVRITGGRLTGIEYPLPVASAQVKSCVLLAGLFAEGATTVIEPKPTRDHTERLCLAAGIPLVVDGPRITVTGFGAGGPQLQPCRWMVPGDFSSAAFWIAAAACREGWKLSAEGVGLNRRRTALLEVLERMGADIVATPDRDEFAGEARGTVRVRGRSLRGAEVGGGEIPNLIDEIPVLAAVAALAEGRTVIRDAGELRVKESDRIATVMRNLSLMGVHVEERPDGMIIHGPAKIRGGASVDSFRDHRVAMSMSVLALSADAPVRINDVACVATSYPGFWDDLRRLGGHVEDHYG